MSIFCGKCDFYDGFVEIRCDGDEAKISEELKNLELFIRGKDGRTHRVKSDTIKDIAKYYPYLECIMVGNKGKTTIILASDSFIDQEEKEHIGWYVESVLKYWRKCKRKKKPFTVDECVDSMCYLNNSTVRAIAERVAKDGDKAEFDDIHLSLHEYYRRRWFGELVRLGYTELEAYDWCFKGFFDSKEIVIRRLGRPLND